MFAILITFLYFLNPMSAFSKNKKIFTVGVEAITFLPYSEVNNNKYQGIFKDILDDFAKKQNIQLSYKPLPISRLYSDFYNGYLDFKLPSNEYWQKDIKEKRNLTIKYSNPIVNYIDGVMVKTDRLKKGIEKLKSLGIVSGFTPWEYLGRINKKQVYTRENPSINGLLQQGILNRVDGVYINIPVGEYYLREDLKKDNHLIFDKSLPHTKSSYHLASINHQKIIEEFNIYLKKHSSFVTSLKQKYRISSY